MPTYDYKCSDCGSKFEVFHGMTETPEVVCKSCQSKNTAKMISLGAGVVFKGAGFYVNDYKKNSADSGSTTAGKKTAVTTETSASVPAEAAVKADTAHSCGPNCKHAS